MAPTSSSEVTQLLAELTRGNRSVVDHLLPLVYSDMRRMAGGQLRNERRDHTLQATALVHEAYLRLVEQHSVKWQNRAHFLGVASQVMRYILLDYAKRHRTAKRGGEAQKVELEDVPISGPAEELIALDSALTALEELDPQQAKVVELRFYGGLSVDETAEVLSISTATVKREWSMARAWLRQQLSVP